MKLPKEHLLIPVTTTTSQHSLQSRAQLHKSRSFARSSTTHRHHVHRRAKNPGALSPGCVSIPSSTTNRSSANPSSDLKNTSDDALPNYLNSLKFTQDNKQLDVRLALGYAAVTIAGALFYFDWKYGWDATKAWTGPAVAAYFVLNCAFMYWMYVVEKGLVYAGDRDGQKVCQTTTTQRL